MKYIIREARYEDAEWIARVHIQSWKETYTWIISGEYLANRKLNDKIKEWEEILVKKQKIAWNFIVETKEGEVVGFASWWKARTEIGGYKWELYCIYILKEHQWHNLGYLLTQKICSILFHNGMLNMMVAVLEDNSSKYFYTKYGAKLLRKVSEKIWEQELIEEIYGWDDFKLFGI